MLLNETKREIPAGPKCKKYGLVIEKKSITVDFRLFKISSPWILKSEVSSSGSD